MKRVRALAAAPALLCAVVLGGPTAGSAPAGAATVPVGCALAGATVSVAQGPVGAGNFNVIIEVKNARYEPCVLPAFPSVDLSDDATGSSLLPTESPQGPLGPGPTPARTPAAVTLGPGRVASALLGGTEIPHDGAASCLVFAAAVTLPGSSQPTTFDRPLPDCSGFVLGPFTLGFNGVSPTGKVVGTAPPCVQSRSLSVASRSVQITAWQSGKVADFVLAVANSTASKRYQMVLSPGRYRITSGELRPRRAVVRAGQVENVGRFGACNSQPRSTLRTVPPRGLTQGPTTTMPTARPGVTPPTTPPTGGNEVTAGPTILPCANDQIRISAFGYGAGAGSASEVIAFTNISAEPCSLTGYPGVAALDNQGHQVEQARRQLNAMSGGQYEGAEPQTIPLEPHEMATATVEGTDHPITAASCPEPFPEFLVTAPDDTESVTLTLVGMQGPGFANQGFPACSPLVVTPVVPGTTGSPPPTP